MPLPVRTVDDVLLDCPHCGQPVRELIVVPVEANLGKRYAYGCSQCRKLLGVSHRKGFWMG